VGQKNKKVVAQEDSRIILYRRVHCLEFTARHAKEITIMGDTGVVRSQARSAGVELSPAEELLGRAIDDLAKKVADLQAAKKSEKDGSAS
jgi:hypothetical protein